MATINDRLIEIRKHFGYSQIRFAKIVDVNPATVCNAEKPNGRVSKAYKNKLSNALLVNLEWLETGNGEMFLESKPEQDLAIFIAKTLKLDENDPRKRLLMVLSKIPEKDWSAVATAFEYFVKQFKE